MSDTRTDDEVIKEFMVAIQADDAAKKVLANAVRSKELEAIDRAVQWVVTNVVRPLRETWDEAVAFVRALLR